MPQLVLGPLLRYVGSTQATVWVETDAPCTVDVLGNVSRTFHVEGHHYALVLVDELEPGTITPYEVRLDGTRVWPPADGRPGSAIRTRQHERRARLVFGSCRAAAPHRPPYTLPKDRHREALGVDALRALSQRLQAGPDPRPDCLLLLGDQVYADEASPGTREFIRSRRDPSVPPGEQVADFEEYTRLYRESWGDPDIRWLLATVPSTMIFDDHDLHDDWNISESWVREMRELPWWERRVVGAFMSYWLYQHLGNLAPPELARERLLEELRGDVDGGPRLRRFAHMADRESAAGRWAYHRDFGRSRLVVVDSRAARVLRDGRREMIDEAEWTWITEHLRGDFDHLIIASTLPVFLLHAAHHLEAWNEAVCDGAWGTRAARAGERLRRALDLEHWAAFHRSFTRMVGLLDDVATGAHGGTPPATITLLGGDVHHAYIAEVTLSEGARSRVFQLVCSPFRNPLGRGERTAIRVTASRAAARITRWLARRAGVGKAAADWRLLRGPSFQNSVAVLELDGRAARVTVHRSALLGDAEATLTPLYTCVLAQPEPGGADAAEPRAAVAA